MVTGTRVCRSDRDCAARSSAASVCVTPSLENQTRFIRVTHPPNTHMLFVGYPPHLQHAGTSQHSPPHSQYKQSLVLITGEAVGDVLTQESRGRPVCV